MRLWTAATAGEPGALVRGLPAGDGLDAIVYGSGLGDLVEVCRRLGGGCSVDVAAWTWRRDDAEAWERAVRAGLIAGGRFVSDETRLHPYQMGTTYQPTHLLHQKRLQRFICSAPETLDFHWK